MPSPSGMIIWYCEILPPRRTLNTGNIKYASEWESRCEFRMQLYFWSYLKFVHLRYARARIRAHRCIRVFVLYYICSVSVIISFRPRVKWTSLIYRRERSTTDVIHLTLSGHPVCMQLARWLLLSFRLLSVLCECACVSGIQLGKVTGSNWIVSCHTGRRFKYFKINCFKSSLCSKSCEFYIISYDLF